MNILADAPPVTKVWISSVIAVSTLTYLNYVNFEEYAQFTDFQDILFSPGKLFVSICYCVQLNLLGVINIYQMLSFLSDMETFHMRSTKHFLVKLGSMLGLIFIFRYLLPFFIAPRLFGYDFFFSRIDTNLIYDKTFKQFTLQDLLILNLQYYQTRFQNFANFNNWFNAHPIVFYLMNLYAISSKVSWKSVLLFFLPGHTLYYLDTIASRTNNNQPNWVAGLGLLFSLFVWIQVGEVNFALLSQEVR
ncbi:hypothetical protein QEN19_001505 [Hanseniaspora menglaensis]